MHHHVHEDQDELNDEKEAEEGQDTRFEAARFHISIIAQEKK
jgi:hypothetical protein